MGFDSLEQHQISRHSGPGVLDARIARKSTPSCMHGQCLGLNFRGVAQLGERWFWEPEAAGAKPATPTILEGIVSQRNTSI